MTGSRRAAAALVVAFVLVGLLDHYLVTNGAALLGAAVFLVGYGSIVLAAWYLFLRPLDMIGSNAPAGVGTRETGDAEDRDERPE